MNCPEIRQQMSRAIDLSLDISQERDFQAHIESCERCGAEFAAMMSMDKGMRELGFVLKQGDPHYSASVRDVLRKRIERNSKTSALLWARGLAFASVLVAAVLLGGFLGQTLFSLAWDGSQLEEEIAVLVPTEDISMASIMSTFPGEVRDQ
jgi:anti-sigma factor RsiW